MSVLIAVPTYETIATECYKALWELDGAGHELMFDAVKGYDCALARIKACEAAQQYGAEWLLMVDSDTVLPPDALANMLEHDAPLTLGYYQSKPHPKGETCIWKAGGWASRYRAAEFHALEADGVTAVRVSGGGLGCALLRVRTLDGVPKPWFRWVVEANGSETGEDIYFCKQLNRLGVPIIADTRVACGHAYRTLHQV